MQDIGCVSSWYIDHVFMDALLEDRGVRDADAGDSLNRWLVL